MCLNKDFYFYILLMTGNVFSWTDQSAAAAAAEEEGSEGAQASLCCVFTSSTVAGHIPEILVVAPPAERDALLLHSVPVKVFLPPVLPRLA